MRDSKVGALHIEIFALSRAMFALILVLLFFGSAIDSVSAKEVAIVLPNFGLETQIYGIYQKSDGGIVLSFGFRKGAELFEDFYDVNARRRLAENLAGSIAHNRAMESEIIQRNQLRSVLMQPSTIMESGEIVTVKNSDAVKCQWPYNREIHLDSAKLSGDVVLFAPLDRPVRGDYERYCGAGSGGVYPLITKYSSEPNVGAGYDRSLLVLMRGTRYAIQFFNVGDLLIQRRVSAIVTIKSSIVREVSSRANAAAGKQQKYVTEIEKIVSTVGATSNSEERK